MIMPMQLMDLTAAEGDGIDVTIADFRDGFRLISYPVDCRKPEAETPHLPVAKQLWTPKCGLKKGSTEWIKAISERSFVYLSSSVSAWMTE